MAQEKLMTHPCTISRTAALRRLAPSRGLLHRVAQCMALIVVIGTLMVLGCGGDSGSPFNPVTANDLNDRAFPFPNGAGPNVAAVIGLPSGQAFTLEFGSFGGTNVGPVTLDSGGNLASGTVTLGSCTFRFDQSTFPAGSGPPSGAQFTIDPCNIDRDKHKLQRTAPSGENLVSAPAISLPTTNVAFVLTSDFAQGSYAVVDLASRNVFRDLKRGGVHSDAIA